MAATNNSNLSNNSSSMALTGAFVSATAADFGLNAPAPVALASCYVAEASSAAVSGYHYCSTRDEGVQWRS